MTGYTAFVLMYNSMYIIVVIIINITTTATTNIIVIIIYPLTARVVVAPPMISQPISSIFFSVLHCPLGLSELQACNRCWETAAHAIFSPISGRISGF